MHVSLPLRLALSAIVNSMLAAALDHALPQYVSIVGGVGAFITIGSLLTLMNVLVRPILNLVSLPFKLIATLLTIITMNGLFLWLTYQIILYMDPAITALRITGGLPGWLIVSSILGVANWLMKAVL